MALISTMLEAYCYAERPTIARDSASGVTQQPWKRVWGNKADGSPNLMPCSVQEASATVRALYAQRNTLAPTTVYFATDPNLEVNDRLIITDRTKRPFYYLVLGEAQPVGRGRFYGLEAERIRAP